jgi:hypothetical protein
MRMYRGFNLAIEMENESWLEHGKEIGERNKQAVEKTLMSFVANGGALDGTKVQQHWFPRLQAEVFISHSHSDAAQATTLAGWLHQTFGLMPFIDSAVWGYSDELLKLIDDIYCLNEDKLTYSYERRNGSTSHVHMMLSTALQMMMDSCECVIFLNTPNSITSSDAVNKTLSPWLFMELAMIRLVRRKTPQDHRRLVKRAGVKAEMRIEYEVDLTGLFDINEDSLIKWRAEYREGVGHPLDCLYRIVPDKLLIGD